MITPLIVGLGGIAGALLRFALDSCFAARRLADPEQSHPGARPSRHWPYATLLVNITGAFIIGTAAAAPAPDHGFHLALTTGLAGALTTFSSWTVATVGLWQEGRRRAAVANVLLNLGLGLAAAALGLVLFD